MRRCVAGAAEMVACCRLPTMMSLVQRSSLVVSCVRKERLGVLKSRFGGAVVLSFYWHSKNKLVPSTVPSKAHEETDSGPVQCNLS